MVRYKVPFMHWEATSGICNKSDTPTTVSFDQQTRYATIRVTNSSARDTATWYNDSTTAGSTDQLKTYEFWLVGDPSPHYVDTDGIHWTGQSSRLPHSHKPEDFIYIPGEEEPRLGLTQRLAPIEEMCEVDGISRVITHFAKLLQDPEYRKQQLEYLNRVNREIGALEVKYDEDAVLFKIQRLFGQYANQAFQMLAESLNMSTQAIIDWFKSIPVDALTERLKKFEEQRKYFEKIRVANAQNLLQTVLTPTELMSLRENKRILVSRLGENYEILSTGKVNKLLPNGEKKGLCVISKLCGLPIEDVIAMKKLLLVSSPRMFEQVANKTSPFQLN